jgi:hypothetical protein
MAAKKPDTQALSDELLRLRKKHADVFAREKEIKADLIGAALAEGDSLKIVVERLGTVKVSPPKDARCTGTAPQIVVEAFLALPEREKGKLTERGIVKIAEQWTGKYYGSVTAELFP